MARGRALQAGLVVSVCLFAAMPRAGPLVAVAGQRYTMGTMFDVVVYHHARTDAEHAIDRALAEIARLDRVLSHFDAGSDLSVLVRHADAGARRVDARLYEIIEMSLEISRRSAGTFDITVGPLVRTYRAAREHGRHPSAEEIGAARACIGYEKIELVPPDRIRLNGECLDIDLGGIGKGYAVDRAVSLLREAGIRHAVVNAGGSSIGAIGAPPGRAGWPVVLATDTASDMVVLLRDQSLGTSRAIAGSTGGGEILDPRDGVPASGSYGVSVLAPAAAVSDALATALVMLPIEQGAELVARFDDVAAVWLSPQGVVEAVHGRPGLSGPVLLEQ
jgi:FAD:protein FMN transferase